MIGGKVLDASTVAAYVRGSIAAQSWAVAARLTGIVLVIPELSLHEVRSVFPWAEGQLAELLDNPSIVVVAMTARTADHVAHVQDAVSVFDPATGHVVHLADLRGWPVLSADSGRLQRVAPDTEIERL